MQGEVKERKDGREWEASSSSFRRRETGCGDLTLPGESFWRPAAAVGAILALGRILV